MNTAFEISSGTDRGRVRRRNEDCVMVSAKHGLAILSDGMGGHRAGDVASRMAVDVLTREFAVPHQEGSVISKQLLARGLNAANTAIRKTAKSKPECEGMGATILVAVFTPHKVIAAHLGDSRLYLYEDNDLTQLTRDHTVAQHYLNQGLMDPREAKNSAGRNMLLRALGIHKTIEPEFTEIPVKSNQVYILCSDGLTDAVSDEQIRIVIRTGLATQCSLRHTINELIALANRNGGPDNISIVMARAINGLIHA